MDVRVDYSPMQETMSEVEEKIFTNHKESDLKHESFCIWQIFHRHAELNLPVASS
jgi:hypothetical protein